MSQNIFDPKLYKHVKSDKHSTTLKHKKGHTLTIAHNVISPKMRTALEALSKIPQENATAGQAQEAEDQHQYGKIIQKAGGGKIHETNRKQIEAAKRLYPEPSHEEKKRRADNNKTMDEFMRNTAGKPMKVQAFEEGGKVAIPSNGQSSYSDRQKNLSEASKVESTTTDKSQAATASDPSQMWENIKNGWAKGGEIHSKGVSEQGRDVRHAKRQSDPKEIELAKHFAREEAKGRADFERTAVKPKMKGLADGGAVKMAGGGGLGLITKFATMFADGGPVMMAKGGRMKSEVAGLPDWFHSAGEQAEAGYTNPDYASKGPGSEANFAYEHGLPCRNPNCKSHGRPHPNCRCYSFAEGGKVQHVCGMNLGHYPDCEHYTQPRQKYAHGTGGVMPYGMSENDMPKDEDQTEQEMDQYEAQNPSRVEQSNEERQQSRIPDFMQQPSSGPMLRPGMPGYDEQHDPIDDTEDPPTGSEAETDPRMYDKIHSLDQNNPNRDQYARNPAQAQQQSQPNDPGADTVQPGSDTVDMGAQPQGSPQAATPEEHAAGIMQEREAFHQDLINGHITPKTYGDLMYHKKDGSEKTTLGKIGSIFGLMLSTIGSGLSGGPNLSMQMMDNALKLDLDAQIKSKENAQNFYRLNQQMLLNDANIQNTLASAHLTDEQKAAVKQSIDMHVAAVTYNQLGVVATETTRKIAEGMPEGSEKIKATQAAMMVAEAAKENGAKAAAMAAGGINALGMYGANPSQNNLSPQDKAEQEYQSNLYTLEQSGPDGKARAQYARERHIPGVPGTSTKPLTETPDVEPRHRAMNILDNKVKDVLDFAQQHRGATWATQDGRNAIKTAKQKAEELTAFYNDSVGKLGMTEGRLGWLEKQIKTNPTSLIEQILGNNATLREIRDSNNVRHQQMLHDVGFPVPAPKQSGPQYKTDANGVTWKRGPRGEAIKVK